MFGNRWLRVLLGAAASVGLAWVITHTLAWGDVARAFVDFPVAFTALAVVPLLASKLLAALRWQALLIGERVSLWQVLFTQNTGIGLNNLLPVRMVSEPVQLAVITRHYKVRFPNAFTSLVTGNVMDIFATAVFMGIGVILVPELRGASIQLAGAFIMFIVSLLVFVVVARGISAVPIARGSRFFQQVSMALGLLRGSPGRLWLSFFASVTHWLLLGLSGWIIARALGLDVDPLTMTTVLVATTFFTSAVPSLPGAAGTYEFAVVYSLGLLGVERPAALVFAVVMHVLVFAPPVIIAIVMLSRIGGEVLSRNVRVARERMAGGETAAAKHGGAREPGAR